MRVKKLLALPVVVAAMVAVTGCAEEKPASVKQEATQAPADIIDEEAEVPSEEPEDVVDGDNEEPESPTTATLGDTVEVGPWDVKVTNLALNANDVVKQTNEFNEPPKGVYVLVTYEATYNGSERTADVWVDLTWTFTTSDQQINDITSVVIPADNESWPTSARQGGTVKHQVAFDLPKKLIKGGLLTVEGYDENFDTVYADFAV